MSTPREQTSENNTSRPGQRKGATKANPTDAEINQRRLQVGRMVSEQVLQSEMAERLGISRSTLSRDLAVIKAEWRSQVRVQYADALSQEVAALDQLERIIWTTHFKECDDALSLRIDLRAVTALLAIKDRRYRLLGLVGPPKPEIRPLPLLTDEEYEADERAMMTRLKRGD